MAAQIPRRQVRQGAGSAAAAVAVDRQRMGALVDLAVAAVALNRAPLQAVGLAAAQAL